MNRFERKLRQLKIQERKFLKMGWVIALNNIFIYFLFRSIESRTTLQISMALDFHADNGI